MSKSKEEIEAEIQEKEAKKEAKRIQLEKEKEELILNLQNNNIGNMREKVAYILNNSMATRNSDIELCWVYWSTFHKEKIQGGLLTKEAMFDLPKMASIVRERAKIQNDFDLFQANEEVKKYRGKLEEKYKDLAVEDKPQNLPIYSVYIDETGKTEQYISVGSLWILDGFSAAGASRKLGEWKKHKGIESEFHFVKLKPQKLELYKEFFIKFLSLNPTAGFKIITVEREGNKNINNIITDLTFHLLHKGINHENESGRAPLPRRLQVTLDPEEKGSDNIKIENLKERLTSQKIEGLKLGNFDLLDSKLSMFVQAVDLVISSVNRKINFPDSNDKVKDEFADFVLGMLDYPLNFLDDINKEVDKSVVFNLMQKENKIAPDKSLNSDNSNGLPPD